jgi:PAS domain S-box-containing protein
LLFDSNPMPMWMYDPNTFEIIDVNEAAIRHYGYSRNEFLYMKTLQLRPAEDINKYLAYENSSGPGLRKSGVWRHRIKDGTIIMVEIMAHDILYEEKLARLILVNDITEKLQAEANLARQREMQQKLITETSIKVQEREREEIGKELHDNINQILTATKLYLEFVMAGKEEELTPELLEKSYNNVDMAIQEIRRLSHKLIAPSLGEISLEQAIKSLIDMISRISPLKLNFIPHSFDEYSIDKNKKLMFYRIVQEQVNNILKHAKAKNASVYLSSTGEHVVLTVKDDGIGFDTDKISDGVGLRNITNRAGFYNGVVRIVSSPGKGCTLEVSVPLERELNSPVGH